MSKKKQTSEKPSKKNSDSNKKSHNTDSKKKSKKTENVSSKKYAPIPQETLKRSKDNTQDSHNDSNKRSYNTRSQTRLKKTEIGFSEIENTIPEKTLKRSKDNTQDLPIKKIKLQYVKKEDNKIKARRLDSLARLLQGSSKCAAACFDGDKILVACNDFHSGTSNVKNIDLETGKGITNLNQDLVVDVMNYLSKVANQGHNNVNKAEAKKEEFAILNQVVQRYMEGILAQKGSIASKELSINIQNLVKYVIDNNGSDLRTLSLKKIAEIAGITNPNQSYGDFIGNTSIAITRLYKDLNNIEQDIKVILKQDEKSRHKLDSGLLEAFKKSKNHLDVRQAYNNKKYSHIVRNYKGKKLDQDQLYGYEILHINGQDEYNLHAEMQIAQRLIDKNEAYNEKSKKEIQLQKPKVENVYIGISLLCCINCHAAIESINDTKSINNQLETKKRIYEAPIIEAIILDEENDVPVELDTKSFLTLSRKGNHNRANKSKSESKDKWVSPYYIGNSNSLYKSAYNIILGKLKADRDKNVSAIQYGSDSEISENEHGAEEKIGMKEKSRQAQSKQFLLEDNLEEINDPLIIENEIHRLQKRLEKLKQNTQSKQLKIKNNAFNQYDSKEYLYQQHDALYIQTQIQKQLAIELDKSKLVFQKALGGADASGAKENTIIAIGTYVKDHIKNKTSSELKSLVGIYNINKVHWIAYSIEPKTNNDIAISYKDSLGEKRVDFEEVMSIAIKEVLPQAKISAVRLDDKKIDQLDGAACGIFALKNMEIMAKAITEGSALSTITNYYNSHHDGERREHDEIIKADREEYAILYAKGNKEELIAVSTEQKTKLAIYEKLTIEKNKFLSNFQTIKITRLKELGMKPYILENESEVEIRILKDEDEEQDKSKLGAYSYNIKIELDAKEVRKELLNAKENLDINEGKKSEFESKLVKSIGGDKQNYYFKYERDTKIVDENNRTLTYYAVVMVANMIAEDTNKNNIDLPKVDKIVINNKEIDISLKDALGVNIIGIPKNLATRLKGIVLNVVTEEFVHSFKVLANENKTLQDEVKKLLERATDIKDYNEIQGSILDFIQSQKTIISKDIELYDYLISKNPGGKVQLNLSIDDIIKLLKDSVSKGNYNDRSSPNILNSNLTHSEKYKKNKEVKLNLKQIIAHNNNKEILDKLKLYADLEIEKQETNLNHNNSIVGKVFIVGESDHIRDHKSNVEALRNSIKNRFITDNTIICIERKQKGDNFGMGDVVFLNNILMYNSNSDEKEKIIINEEIKSLPIYLDACLYNTARKKGIKVVGIEGKHMQNETDREKYITDKVEAIVKSGNNVILLVGSSHINNIASTLIDKQIRTQASMSVKEVTNRYKHINKKIDDSDQTLNDIYNTAKPKNRSRKL